MEDIFVDFFAILIGAAFFFIVGSGIASLIYMAIEDLKDIFKGDS